MRIIEGVEMKLFSLAEYIYSGVIMVVEVVEVVIE